MAGGTNALASLQGKVDANGALVVALDGSSPVSATRFLAGAGTVALPAFTFTAAPNTGFYSGGGTTVGVSVNGVGQLGFQANVASFTSGVAVGWASSADPFSAADTTLARNAARALTLGPTTGVTLRWATDGTLEVRNFANSAVGNLTIGDLTVAAITASSTVAAGAANSFQWTSRSKVLSPADGQVNAFNNASSSGVGLDVNTNAVLKVRTTAQTGYATVDALAYQVSGVAGATGTFANVTVVNGIVTSGT